mmetsp:Transcript_14165/g.37402  ORF Transcript_14165/g.37402 Transcript_14165/m.37402 type:complete len:321 (-) Transcript_14165:144-1106(-)
MPRQDAGGDDVEERLTRQEVGLERQAARIHHMMPPVHDKGQDHGRLLDRFERVAARLAVAEPRTQAVEVGHTDAQSGANLPLFLGREQLDAHPPCQASITVGNVAGEWQRVHLAAFVDDSPTIKYPCMVEAVVGRHHCKGEPRCLLDESLDQFAVETPKGHSGVLAYYAWDVLETEFLQVGPEQHARDEFMSPRTLEMSVRISKHSACDSSFPSLWAVIRLRITGGSASNSACSSASSVARLAFCVSSALSSVELHILRVSASSAACRSSMSATSCSCERICSSQNHSRSASCLSVASCCLCSSWAIVASAFALSSCSSD